KSHQWRAVQGHGHPSDPRAAREFPVRSRSASYGIYNWLTSAALPPECAVRQSGRPLLQPVGGRGIGFGGPGEQVLGLVQGEVVLAAAELAAHVHLAGGLGRGAELILAQAAQHALDAFHGAGAAESDRPLLQKLGLLLMEQAV